MTRLDAACPAAAVVAGCEDEAPWATTPYKAGCAEEIEAAVLLLALTLSSELSVKLMSTRWEGWLAWNVP